jgi:hypothetical protein
MAKKGFSVAILSMVLVFGLVLTGCPTDDDDDSKGGSVPTEFQGTWTGTSTNNTAVSIVIKADGTFTATFAGGYNNTDTGTCSVSGSEISFKTESREGSATLAGTTLTLTKWEGSGIGTAALTKEGSGGSNTPSFDGSSLAGTIWVAETTEDFSEMADGAEAKIKAKSTLDFTSASAGTITVEITEWIGKWDDKDKEFITAMGVLDHVAFTSTYDSTAKTGTVIYSTPSMFDEEELEETNLSFIVNVSAKTLTTTEVDEDDEEDIETTVYTLK